MVVILQFCRDQKCGTTVLFQGQIKERGDDRGRSLWVQVREESGLGAQGSNSNIARESLRDGWRSKHYEEAPVIVHMPTKEACPLAFLFQSKSRMMKPNGDGKGYRAILQLEIV